MRSTGRRHRTPAPPAHQIQPSLPIETTVLRQLGIADPELPHGRASLKHNLLFFLPQSQTSQETNICANSDFSGYIGRIHYDNAEFRKRLENSIAKSSSHPDPEETFKSVSYLDQIALICLAAEWRDCRAPDCLQYRDKLRKVVPVCHSWPGLRNWVLCTTSCSLRTRRDNHSRIEDEATHSGLLDHALDNLLLRFRNHINACILSTRSPETIIKGPSIDGWEVSEEEVDRYFGTPSDCALNGPLSDPRASWGTRDVSSRRVPVLTPEFLTCSRQTNLALHLIHKHLILYQLTLLRFFT